MKNTTLVIHFNAFTGKMIGGYKLVSGRKEGAGMTPAEVVSFLAENLDVRCSPLMV